MKTLMKSTCKWFVYLQNRNTLLSLVISPLLNREPVLAWEQTQSCYSCTGSVPRFLSPSGPSQFTDSAPMCARHDQTLFLQIKIVLVRSRSTLGKCLFISDHIVALGCSSPLQILFAGFTFNQISARQYKYLLCNQISSTESPPLPLPTTQRKKSSSQKQLHSCFS